MLTYAKLALTAFKFIRWLVGVLERRKWISEGRKQVLDEWAIKNAQLTIKRYELDEKIADIPDADTDDWLRKRGSKE